MHYSRNNCNKILLIAVLIILFFQSQAQDYIFTKDGRKLKGEIVKEDSSTVYFYMQNHGNRVYTSVNKTKIAKIYNRDSLNYPDNYKLEVSFNPFAYKDVFSINYYTIKFLIASKAAIRLGFQLDKQVNKNNDEDRIDDEIAKIDENSITYGFFSGFEINGINTNRMNTYWGTDVFFSKRKSSATYGEISVDGGWWHENSIILYPMEPQYNLNRNYLQYGVKLFYGIDFLVYKKLYLGTELGIQWHETNYEKVIVVGIEHNNYSINGYKQHKFELYTTNLFRLGVKF